MIGKFLPEDSTITFMRSFIAIIGPRREIIVDCKRNKKKYPDHPPSYGWEAYSIDDGVYYYRR